MREPETLKELIEFMEYNYKYLPETSNIVFCISDGDNFHELLKNLKEDYEYIERASRRY